MAEIFTEDAMQNIENSDIVTISPAAQSCDYEKLLTSLGLELHRLPVILDGKFFQIKSVIENKLKVVCGLCDKSSKPLSSTLSCT